MADVSELGEAARQAHALFRQNRDSHVGMASLIEANSAWRRMLEDAERQRTLMRSAIGPLHELGAAGLFDVPSPIQQEQLKTQEMMDDFR